MIIGRGLIDATSGFPYLRLQEFFALIIFVCWIISFGNLGSTLITSKKQQIIWTVFLSIYSLGYGIHLVANYLSENLTFPNPAVYFFDEILGHVLIWLGYLGGLGILCYDSMKQKVEKNGNSFGDILTAIIHGGVMALSVIEGQSVVLAGVLSVAISAYILNLKNKHSSLVSNYYLIVLLSNLAVIGLWGMYFRGFPELSELR
jgi:hypothetical protein